MAFQNKSMIALQLTVFKTHLSPLINTLCLYSDNWGRNKRTSLFVNVKENADITKASNPSTEDSSLLLKTNSTNAAGSQRSSG